jgi:hypothetical protein
MNLTALLGDYNRRMRYPTAPPSAVTVRSTAYANETHRDLLTLPALTKLRDRVLPVTLSANARQGLPPIIQRIHNIVDRTNNFKLEQVPLTELRQDDPAQANTGGYGMRYAVIGLQEVAIQPTTTGSGLWIASSAIADTGVVSVEAARLGSFPFYDQQTTSLIGTTRVSVKSINTTGVQTDYIEVDRFYLATAAGGYISLYDAAVAGNELARIPIGRTFSRYLTIELYPVPTAAYTVYIDCTITVPDLVNGTDEPLLWEDFHDLIVLGMRVKEYEFLDDNRALAARGDYQRRVADLLTFVLDDPDRIASLRPTAMRWSQLGGQFPAGS